MKGDRPGKIRIHFRISKEEYEKIKPMLEDIGVGEYFMKVSNLHRDKAMSKKIDARNELSALYKKYNADLSHIGGNLNQRMRHCNELAKIGGLSKDALDEQISIIDDLKNLIVNIQNDLFKITKMIAKF